MLAVKTESKRMTKAYSKISGYDRQHVYVFVSDKKISTLFSKISGYGRKIRWIRVDASRIRKKKIAFSQISGYVWTMPNCKADHTCIAFSGQFFGWRYQPSSGFQMLLNL